MTSTVKGAAAALFACTVVVAAAQEQRPKNVPFYTWVREDTFAGFMADDMTRFERGMQKAREYLNEDASNIDASNWIGAGTIYRAVRAFRAGDDAAGDRLFAEGLAMMDNAAAAQPTNIGVRATAGGTLMRFLAELPDRHYRPALERSREAYAMLYKLQAEQLDRFPPHLRGEPLAGMAEVEFRLGNREAAAIYLNKLVTGMPTSRYGQVADAWLRSPETVTKKDRLVCQSCHEPGRLAVWTARQ